MSYRYGINGNDLDFDFLCNPRHIAETCLDCEAAVKEWKQQNPKHTDAQLDRFLEHLECDGHTRRYSAKGWSIEHDTNHNNVRTYGNVPLSVYDTFYLRDWLEALQDKHGAAAAAKRTRIRKELRERGEELAA